MQNPMQYSAGVERSSVNISKLMRNTYALLSMTLIFSGIMASVAIATNAGHLGLLGFIGMFALLFATQALRNSVWALPMVFVFTGFMGYSLGPIVNHYLAMQNGAQVVATAMSLTGITFLGLSGYAIASGKDFGFMRGMLMAGLFVVIGAILLSFFFSMPGLSLAISAVIVLLMSGFILYDTSRMVNGGETNYVMMTVSLYLNIYNLFTALLHITGAFNND